MQILLVYKNETNFRQEYSYIDLTFLQRQ